MQKSPAKSIFVYEVFVGGNCEGQFLNTNNGENLPKGQLDSFGAPYDGLGYKEFQQLKNKYFPVVYDSTNTMYNDLILEKSDFAKYNIPWKEGL